MSLIVDIEKTLGNFHLDVSFEAQEQEILALLGSSGCGKSMTLKCVAGIERPDRGRIVLNGRTLFDSDRHIDLAPQKRRVGYLFQQYALFPNMTVEQNIRAGCRGRADADRLVQEKIAALGLAGLEKKRPKQLSGGQQQRVALARILVGEPELMLLDEPFSALDSFLRWRMELELADTLRAFGRPAVFVSHSRDEVYRLCDRVCVITEGRSEAVTPVRELFHAPQTLSACLISGCKNFSAIERIGDHRVLAKDWGIEFTTEKDPEPDDAFAGLRSHYIHIVPEAGENTAMCEVERIIDDVFSSVVLVRTPGGGSLRLEMEKDVWAAHENEKQLCIYAAPRDIMLLKK